MEQTREAKKVLGRHHLTLRKSKPDLRVGSPIPIVAKTNAKKQHFDPSLHSCPCVTTRESPLLKT